MENNPEIKIIRKIYKLDFWYKGEFYSYELQEDENESELELIYKGDERIYGPTSDQSNNEGKEIYDMISKNKKI